MNIEENLTSLKEIVAIRKERCHGFIDSDSCLISTKRLETLLTAYEKEKEKNKNIDEFCRKELAFERRLKRENRENREPDEFNQGRFYVSENIRKIIKEE